MRKTDIERIIKQGSTRQKIKLYFTDVAYFNTKGIAQAELKGTVENFSQCSSYYKKCEFDPLCNSPAQFQSFALKAGYTQRVYNPATFGE